MALRRPGIKMLSRLVLAPHCQKHPYIYHTPTSAGRTVLKLVLLPGPTLPPELLDEVNKALRKRPPQLTGCVAWLALLDWLADTDHQALTDHLAECFTAHEKALHIKATIYIWGDSIIK
jgi:hypothetical protein